MEKCRAQTTRRDVSLNGKENKPELSTVDPYLLLRPGECQHTPPSPHTSELAIVSSTGGADKIVPNGNILGSDIPAWSLPRDDQSFDTSS